MIKSISEENFDAEVYQHSGLVLVDFWAEWCGPCRMYTPVLEEVANECKDVKIVKVNIDENVEIATNFGVRSIPTVVVFYNGKKIDTRVGALKKDALIELIGTYLKSNS